MWQGGASLLQHIIWNSTALDCQRKFRDFKHSGKAVARLSDTICVENRLSIVAEPQGRGTHYGAWLGDRREPSQREILRQAIDDALAKHPADLEALLSLLQEAGFEIKRGKHIALRGAGESRFKRLDSLGEGYTEATLCAILAGEKKHTPRTKRMPVPAEKISLLVDIQAKLRAGKGAGYERWAKKFNAKELARTLNYLSEAGVANLADLVQRTENATTHMNKLREDIRQTENRITEIGTLQMHIFNYLKTKDVYAAYRESGYSRKFAEAHQQELALHRAAKAAFDALGTKKIPSIKVLKAEYAELAQKKKQAYQAYRQTREEMRTLIRVRTNVETILNGDVKDVPVKTTHRTQDDAER